jgi:dihydropteroate synthase
LRAKYTPFSPKNTLRLGGKLLDLSSPRVMGILNVTPDSFHSESRVMQESQLLKQAEQMLSQGAAILDVGGYSTRPGAAEVSEAEELNRIVPAMRSLQKHFPEAFFSVDTFRASVAEAALNEGAFLINDISGGEADPQMFSVLSRWQAPYILMHMRGTPQTMAQLNQYDNMIVELIDYFAAKINKLRAIGVHDIVVDPGFGFAKNVPQNFQLLRRLNDFSVLDAPVLAGLSRKSLIWRTLNCSPAEALNGTTALNMLALAAGARLLRVHDVQAAAECVKLFAQYKAVEEEAA